MNKLAVWRAVRLEGGWLEGGWRVVGGNSGRLSGFGFPLNISKLIIELIIFIVM